MNNPENAGNHSFLQRDHNGIDNQIVFEVQDPAEEGIMIDILETDPADPVRNIRIIRIIPTLLIFRRSLPMKSPVLQRLR